MIKLKKEKKQCILRQEEKARRSMRKIFLTVNARKEKGIKVRLPEKGLFKYFFG